MVNVEFIYERRDGQRLLIQGRVALHREAEDIIIDSATDCETDANESLQPSEVYEIEAEALDKAYEVVECAS